MADRTTDLWGRVRELLGGFLGRPGPDRTLGWLTGRSGWLVLALGIVYFLLVQGWVTIYPTLQKKVPLEADDAFAYITKAVQMEECFFQDCPALVDLLEQAEDPDSGVDGFIQFQIFSKTVFVYHPLHSAVLVGLHRLGMTWEGAYQAVWTAGFLVTTAAIALLLAVLFGPGGAGVALLILPFFRTDGLDYMIPTHLVTALAMALWAAVLARIRGLPWLIVAGTLVMLPWHMIGALHVLVILVLYWLTAEPPLGRSRIAATAVSLALLAVHLALPLVLDKPALQVGRFTESWLGPLALFPDNLRMALTTLIRFVESHGGYLICGLLMGVGAAFNHPLRKRRAVLVMWICLGLALASFLPRAPVPGNAFQRIQTPILVLLCGLMGRAGWIWLRDGWAWLWSRLVQSGGAEPRYAPVLFKGPLGLAGLFLIGLALFRVIVFGALEFRVAAGSAVERAISQKNYAFEPGQVQLLTELAGPGERIFYRNIVPMQFYLNHGALKYGAVLNVLLSSGKEKSRQWLSDHRPGFVVTGSPWWGLSDGRPYKDRPIFQWGGALVPQGSGLTFFLTRPAKPSEMVLGVEWTGEPGRIGLTSAEGAWYPLTDAIEGPGLLHPKAGPRVTVSQFTLRASEPFRLTRLGLDHDQKTRWPWDRGVSVRTNPSGGQARPVDIRFASSILSPLPEKRMEVLDDRGSSVLFRLRP